MSRLLFTLSAVGLTVGAHRADLSKSHLFNDRWPPHAKFHTGQTLSMSALLSLLTIFFAWRKTSDPREAVLATAGFASAYWSRRQRQSSIQTPTFTILSFGLRAARNSVFQLKRTSSLVSFHQ
jgi:hypothetical protein